MKYFAVLSGILFLALLSCTNVDKAVHTDATDSLQTLLTPVDTVVSVMDSAIIKTELLYDRHTLADTTTYRKKIRVFQWEKIRGYLQLLDSIQQESVNWAILQNYRNRNGEAPLVRKFSRNEYRRITDSLGVERYQSVPLYFPGDSIPERYGRDGALVKLLQDDSVTVRIEVLGVDGIWEVPRRYVRTIGDTVLFHKAIFVDVSAQNMATFEKKDSVWWVRSKNPVTTGRHNPPYMQETPLGIFVIQEHKPKMIYLKDGVDEHGGFAPFASRFTNGGYIHGIPVNEPATEPVEYSRSLGTTPHSHMCVRTATSHAEFIYNWAPVLNTVVVVID